MTLFLITMACCIQYCNAQHIYYGKDDDGALKNINAAFLLKNFCTLSTDGAKKQCISDVTNFTISVNYKSEGYIKIKNEELNKTLSIVSATRAQGGMEFVLEDDKEYRYFILIVLDDRDDLQTIFYKSDTMDHGFVMF